jgi:hypothetical protein
MSRGEAPAETPGRGQEVSEGSTVSSTREAEQKLRADARRNRTEIRGPTRPELGGPPLTPGPALFAYLSRVFDQVVATKALAGALARVGIDVHGERPSTV